jgi:hypothetical protein
MLRPLKDFKMAVIMANDGEIGHVDQFLFDDEKWSIRYLIVKTKWLMGRKVLISPIAIADTDVDLKFVRLSLTRKKIEQSPDIDTDKPVSRQMETQYHDYYQWPYYWMGTAGWGAGSSQMLGRPFPLPYHPTDHPGDISESSGDSHLRSVHVVEGYEIAAKDGVFGHIEDFIVDDKSWVIRYLVVNTHRIWPGKSVILSPDWVNSISWSDRTINMNLTQEKIKNCPEYTDDVSINREYEDRLYDYYGRPNYWAQVSSPRFAERGKPMD